jgi:hypothetical protein
LRCAKAFIGLLFLSFLVTAVHAQTPQSNPHSKAPEMKVTLFLASDAERPQTAVAAADRVELDQVFDRQNFRHFYQMGVQSLRFQDTKTGVVKLPGGQEAFFDFKGVKGQHHLFSLRLPAYGIAANLHVPLNRVFYQAGIQHAGGTLILRIRTTLTP